MRSLAAAFSACATVLAIAGPTFADNLDHLKSELAKNSLTLYQPINSLRGPGWLFAYMHDEKGVLFRVTVCQNAYDGVPNAVTQTPGVIIADQAEKTTIGATLGISLLEKLLKDVASAAFNLQWAHADQVEITWGPITQYELSQKFGPDGSTRAVSASCAANVKNWTNPDGSFKQPLYLVMHAAGVRNLHYKIITATDNGAGQPAGISAKVDAKELFTVNAGITFSKTDTSSFDVKVPNDQAPIFIAGNAVKLKSWSTLASMTPQAKIKADGNQSAPADAFAMPKKH